VATHDVTFELPKGYVGYADVLIKVREDGDLLGTLKISQGAVVWRPGNAKLGYRMGWERFDAAMRGGTRGRF